MEDDDGRHLQDRSCVHVSRIRSLTGEDILLICCVHDFEGGIKVTYTLPSEYRSATISLTFQTDTLLSLTGILSSPIMYLTSFIHCSSVTPLTSVSGVFGKTMKIHLESRQYRIPLEVGINILSPRSYHSSDTHSCIIGTISFRLYNPM